jgi:hypothetical protein
MFALKNIFKFRKNFQFPNLTSRFFSQIRLVTKHGEINRSENPDFNINLNWELAKVWVTPHTNSYINSLKAANSSGTDEQVIVTTIGKITQLDFDRLAKRMGLVISKGDNVYVQDGLHKGKKLRIISSSKEDASVATSLLEETTKLDNPDIHLIYLTDHSHIGTSKKFVLYDKKQKIILSNAKSLDGLKQALENMQ